MSLNWLIDLFLILAGAATTIMVLVTWVSAMGRWELALVNARKEPALFKPWLRTMLESLPWLAVCFIVLLCGLYANNVRLDRQNHSMAKIANERAIAAANATALANAGLMGPSDVSQQPGAVKPGGEPKDNMLAAPMPMDTDSLKSMSITDASKKVLAAKKAQQEAVDLLIRNTAFGALANKLITGLLVVIIAFSLAFFFSNKVNGVSKMDHTWLLYFIIFLSLGAGAVNHSGTVKIFRESPDLKNTGLS